VATVGALAVADVDADGRQDLVLGYRSFEGGLWRSGLDLALREPDGGWSRRTLYTEESRAGFTALDGGDLDRDGRPDLVAGTGDGRLLVLLNDGDGAFHREEVTLTEAAGSCRCYHLEIADLDGDGGGDLVAALAGEAEGLDFLGTKGCPGEGSLRAWRVRPLGDAAAGGGTTPGTTVSTEGP
jgi:hypothetical protein